MVTESEEFHTIISMGFPEGAAREALHKHSGNLDRALDSLLSPQPYGSNDFNADESGVNEGSEGTDQKYTEYNGFTIVSTDISQFTLANGRSACTCIALSGARSGLQSLSKKKTSSSPTQEVFTTEFIQNALFSGIGIYENKLSVVNDVEHMSVEEVIRDFPQFSSELHQVEHVRQGILSSPGVNGDNGLQSTLLACRESREAKINEWMAVVMTKTPETVTIFLPPPSQASETSDQQVRKFVLLDSHPRPNIFYYNGGSYAMICDSMEDLLKALEKVFPLTDLGEDVSEIMAMMYNSFDMYAFQL